MSPDDAKAKLSFWKQHAEGYANFAQANNGYLTRSEDWYNDYCLSPYLTFASTDYLSKRFIDHFHNNMRLDSLGRICPRLEFADDHGIFGPLFAHLWLEYQSRGGIPQKTISDATYEVGKYFLNGEPTGTSLFKRHPETLQNVIVKFGKRDHLEQMITHGEVRLTPSSFYSRGSLLKAMRDMESAREFHIPAFENVLRGESSIKFRGLTGQIQDGFVKLVMECPNYVLWCACRDIDRRLPDDFNADAALIVRHPDQFAERFIKAVETVWQSGKTWFGPVTYYDPCSRAHLQTRPELIKHFSFAYQREWRICFFPSENDIPEEPFSIEIGDLRVIAQLVKLPQ
ncbi:hypothetical protein E4L95_02010 [Paracoccus liaowanqingii]|uniref:Uncharacterized protein n=1 Tax=Paracoccus liaowanqingii TaxID=2560053 RepID=A0A4Z1CSY7_9RHOB|nr:hypothetical protein [Paracoccus liaowanqingii]TGN68286.1 hypothetical protein E4L95_02010 [Paracoccus liaowanqingii]